VKITDIGPADLRAWVQGYVEGIVSKKKSSRQSAQPQIDIWRSFNEADWRAWRELIDLREKADLQFSRSQIDVAIYDGVRAAPALPGYTAPYTLGIEARALRGLLGLPEPARSEVTYVDFHAQHDA